MSSLNFYASEDKMKIKIASCIIILLPVFSYADAYNGKEDIRPDGKKTIAYNHERPGALLPFKTWNDWDGKDRPCCWDGYGIDPGTVTKYGRVNWYIYYNENTECYPGYDSVWEGTDHCKQEIKEADNKTESVPEPEITFLVGIGLLFLGLYLYFKQRIDKL